MRKTGGGGLVAVQVLGEAPEPAGGNGPGRAAGSTAERLLDLAGGFGGGVASRAAVDVAVDAFCLGGVELAVDPGVDDAAGPEVLDWVHVPETRRPSRRFPRNPTTMSAGSHRVTGSPAADDRARRQAFATHVVPEIDVLLRVAYTLVPRPADAEDLVQDTLLRAFQAMDGFDGRHPRAWLLTIMRHTQINRTRRRRPELLDDPDRDQPVGSDAAVSPEALVVGEMFDGEVETALDSLPTRLRQVVELVDVNGLSYAEAAEVMGVPGGTVMSRLHRARSRMRARLVAAGVNGRAGRRSP